ncbi:hypothetical protein PAGU2196_41440 [Pseudomonas sp. PAGU 2196]|nr:hypothetical protein PAGU2196_41440 [Pseudomonas sp. PAGU 2196]
MHVCATQQLRQAIGKLEVYSMFMVRRVLAGVEQHNGGFRVTGSGHRGWPVCNECTWCEAGVFGKFSRM